MLAVLSKVISEMPLLEGVELTVDDCILKERNVYLKQIQPVDTDGKLIGMSEMDRDKLIDPCDSSSDGETKIRTRISSEKVDKINRAFQECRIEHKRRVPKHDIVTEIKTFDSFHVPSQAFSAASLGVVLLQLAMQRQINLNLAGGACAAATEENMGHMTLKDLVGMIKFPGIGRVKKLIAEFGVGWVEGFLYEVVRLSQSEMKELKIVA